MSPAVSNTSPLTNLAIIGRLGLVQAQLGGVAVPDAVWREMLALPHHEGHSALLAAREAGWLQVVTLDNAALAASLRLAGLDEGESEAIALAVETGTGVLLIDERKGRVAARKLGVTVTGALAILAVARKLGAISSAKTEIDRLRCEAGFFVSPEVEGEILRMAGEI